jgi:hypothetical protein
MSATLIYMGKLNANGFNMRIRAGELSVTAPEGMLCGAIPCIDGLYCLGGSPASPTALSATTFKLYKLHCCLRHRNYMVLLDMLQNSRLQGISVTDHMQVECRKCCMAKATHALIARLCLSPLAKEYSKHHHMSVWGPMATAAVNHARYFLMIVDDAKCWMSPRTLVKKSDAFARCCVQERLNETQYGVVTKILQSDRSGKFLSKPFDEHLKAKGIVCKLTLHNTPEHNGVSERHIRTIVDTMHTYFAASGLSRWLWGECLRMLRGYSTARHTRRSVVSHRSRHTLALYLTFLGSGSGACGSTSTAPLRTSSIRVWLSAAGLVMTSPLMGIVSIGLLSR